MANLGDLFNIAAKTATKQLVKRGVQGTMQDINKGVSTGLKTTKKVVENVNRASVLAKKPALSKDEANEYLQLTKNVQTPDQAIGATLMNMAKPTQPSLSTYAQPNIISQGISGSMGALKGILNKLPKDEFTQEELQKEYKDSGKFNPYASGSGALGYLFPTDLKSQYSKLKPEDVEGLKSSLRLKRAQEVEEQSKFEQEALNEAMASGNMQFYKGARKYTGSAAGEAEQMQKEALLDIPEAAIKGFLGGKTMGIIDKLAGKQIERPEPIYQQNEDLKNTLNTVKGVIGTAASFAGGASTYGAIANKVGQTLKSIPKLSPVLAEHPVFTAYIAQNVGEEIVEAGVRKATGQEYGFNDFMYGLGMGTAFQGAFNVKDFVGEKFFKQGIKEADTALRAAEAQKGTKLTPIEVEQILRPLPVGNHTWGSLFDQARLAYKTGGYDVTGMNKMTSLKDMSGRPSVTDIGVNIPAKPEGVISQVPDINKGISKGDAFTRLAGSYGEALKENVKDFNEYTKSQLTDIWNKAHGIAKTGANEFSDKGKISEAAARKVEMEEDFRNKNAQSGKETKGANGFTDKSKISEKVDTGRAGTTGTRRGEAIKNLLSQESSILKKAGLPTKQKMEAIADSGFTDTPKELELTGTAKKPPKPYSLEIDKMRGSIPKPEYNPVKEVPKYEDIDWDKITTEDFAALPESYKKKLEQEWLKDEMQDSKLISYGEEEKQAAKGFVNDFAKMISGKDKIKLTGFKKFTGEKGMINAGLNFKSTMDKLFLTKDRDSIVKNLQILSDHFKGTEFGIKVDNVLSNITLGRLDNADLFSDYIIPELQRVIDTPAVKGKQSPKVDINRMSQAAQKAIGVPIKEVLKDFAHKAIDTNYLKKFGESGKRLSKMMDNADRDASIGAGWQMKEIAATIKKLNNKQLYDFQRVADGKMDINIIKDEAVKNAYYAWDMVRRDIAEQAKELGLKIKNSKGEKFDFKPNENFFPHILKEDMLAKVLLKKDKKAELIQEMAKNSGGKMTEADALYLLDKFMRDKRSGEYSHLERARENIDLPERFYETNPKKVLFTYIEGANKRLADARQFGANYEKVKLLAYKLFKEGGDAENLIRVFDRLAGRDVFDPTSAKISSMLRSFQTITKLGLSAITNLGDILKPFVRTNVLSTVKGIVSTLGNRWLGGRDFAESTGVLKANMDRMLRDVGGENYGRKFMRWTQFERIERGLSIIGANAGKNYAEMLFKKLKKNPNNIFARRRLEQLDIDVDEALKGNVLSEMDKVKAGYKAVSDMQPIRRQDTPYYWQSPSGKTFTQFKSFSLKHGNFMKEFVFKEATKGNVKPLISFIIGGLIVGEAVADLKSAVRFRERNADIWGRIFDNYMTVGGLGLATDFFSNVVYGQSGSGLYSFFAGPTISDLINGITAVGTDLSRVATGKGFAGLGEKSSSGKAQSRVLKEIIQKIPVVGQPLRGILLPSKQSYKARTAEEQEDIYESIINGLSGGNNDQPTLKKSFFKKKTFSSSIGERPKFKKKTFSSSIGERPKFKKKTF